MKVPERGRKKRGGSGEPDPARIGQLKYPKEGAVFLQCYIDFPRLYHLHRTRAFFVVRAKKNLRSRRRYSHAVDRSTGIFSDQTIMLTDPSSLAAFSEPLRRIRYRDPESGKRFVFLTNDFTLPSLSIAELYRQRWQVELFLKWIKQHLRIKAFYGTTPNAVYIQIWAAISTYVLVAIVRKRRLGLDLDLYTLLQIFSLTLSEKVPMTQALTGPGLHSEKRPHF